MTIAAMHRPTTRTQHGISLIEVLVGIAVGLIGILVIFQTIAVWDKHTRTSTSGSDVQIAGLQAMFNLERDVRSAGFGFARASGNIMGCPVEVRGNAINFPLAPVRISSSPTGDTIEVFHGNSSHYVVAEEYTDATPSTKKLKRRGGFKAGDMIVITGNATASGASARCVLAQVTDTSNGDGVTIGHVNGSYSNFYSGAAASATINLISASGAAFTSGMIFNLGPLPQHNRWAVTNGVLTAADDINLTQPFAVAEGVVEVRAQYGVDSNGDFRITDSGPNEWQTAAPADWTRILAIRVAILVRGQQFEKDGDTANMAASGVVPAWFGTTWQRDVNGVADTAAASSPDNWRNYRYRVYERVIPLRNMIWGTL